MKKSPKKNLAISCQTAPNLAESCQTMPPEQSRPEPGATGLKTAALKDADPKANELKPNQQRQLSRPHHRRLEDEETEAA